MKSPFTRTQKQVPVEETLQFVTFVVGTEEYGLPIGCIVEAVRPLKITPLPRMPKFVEGMINLRGTLIPVVDLRKRFALDRIRDDARTMRMVITRGAAAGAAGGGKDLLGLVVDGVREVLTLPKQNIDQAPRAATGASADFIAGVGKAGERLVILIDITKILSRQEQAALAEAEHG